MPYLLDRRSGQWAAIQSLCDEGAIEFRLSLEPGASERAELLNLDSGCFHLANV